MSLTSDARREVEQLIRDGKKIEAIKYLTKTFNVSLIEAKTLVETLEAEGTVEFPKQSEEISMDVTTLRNEVAGLLRSGKKLDAVKLAKSTLDSSLKDAVSYVEEVEAEIGLRRRKNPSKKDINVFKLVGSIFAGVGVLLMLIGFIVYKNKASSIATSDGVPGVVVEFHTSKKGNYAPVVEYEWNGKKELYYSDVFASPSPYELDEKVTVLVNRNDPTDVTLDTFSERWIAIVILGGLGTFFFLFGSLFVYVSRKF